MSRHAVSFLELKALDAEQRTIEGWATRPETDRVGDIVESKGAVYRLPLPLLMDHDHSSAVGEVISATVSEAGIRFKAKIAKIAEPGPIKDLCDSAWSAAKAGLRRAVSIGFRPLKAEPLPNGGTRFLSWDWYELSMVAVPALATATIDQVKAFDRDLRRKAGRGRVVRLDDQSGSHRVVRLADPVRAKSSLSPSNKATPIADAVDAELAKLEEAETRMKAIKELGFADALAIGSVGAIARTTDAELATIRARLKALEAKRG
jgi:phage head maturation protease